MQEHFYQLSEYVHKLLAADEVYTAFYFEENTDFCRLNHAKIRQPGHVIQRELDLRLIRGGKQCSALCTLAGVLEEDKRRLADVLSKLRLRLDVLPADPYLLYATEVNSSELIHPNKLPQSEEVLATVLGAASDLDLVGVYASGSIKRGFANSFGQRNWYESHSFNLDFSVYHKADRAVKSGYAGFDWSDDAFTLKLNDVRHGMDVIRRPPKKLEPGAYRAYLAPAAMGELFDLLSWGGFSLKGLKTERSSLRRLFRGETELSSQVSLAEDVVSGVGPNFDELGFTKPEVVALINEGRYAGSLVSARSAKEYDIAPNGADSGESPESLTMAAGTLERDKILDELGTGVMINNLWYLNYSDRPACRITGMTRFATFWVENSEIVAPIEVMRFDDTLYRMLGSQLCHLTAERELLLSSSTYGRRATSCQKLPGAVIDDFQFTL